MAESFILFDSDFARTNNTDAALYIVITNTAKAIGDDELFHYWLDSDSDSFTSEIEDIINKQKDTTNWTYYYWEDCDEKYLPLKDYKIVEKLNKIIESFNSDSSESESSKANNINSISKKYKLSIILENGTTIEPNFTSADPADLTGMIELMSSERYFAGKIKSIKIE